MGAESSSGHVVCPGLVSALVLVLGACGGDSTGPAADEAGSIRVTIQTSAATSEAAMDPDGYVVVVEGLESRPAEADAEVTLTGIPAGQHTVELRELQANCTTPLNPVTAIVVAGGTTPITFQVTCWPPTSGRIAFASDRELGMDTLSTFRNES